MTDQPAGMSDELEAIDERWLENVDESAVRYIQKKHAEFGPEGPQCEIDDAAYHFANRLRRSVTEIRRVWYEHSSCEDRITRLHDSISDYRHEAAEDDQHIAEREAEVDRINHNQKCVAADATKYRQRAENAEGEVVRLKEETQEQQMVIDQIDAEAAYGSDAEKENTMLREQLDGATQAAGWPLVRLVAAGLVDCDPGRRGGQPVMHGTRFPLSQVFAQIAAGDSVPRLASNFDIEERSLVALFNELDRMSQNPARPAAKLDAVEIVADFMHDQWAHWWRYSEEHHEDENIKRWNAQAATSYEMMSEEDKEKDRVWARKLLAKLDEGRATLLDAKGSLKLPEGKSSVDVVREMRDEWEPDPATVEAAREDAKAGRYKTTDEFKAELLGASGDNAATAKTRQLVEDHSDSDETTIAILWGQLNEANTIVACRDNSIECLQWLAKPRLQAVFDAVVRSVSSSPEWFNFDHRVYDMPMELATLVEELGASLSVAIKEDRTNRDCLSSMLRDDAEKFNLDTSVLDKVGWK